MDDYITITIVIMVESVIVPISQLLSREKAKEIKKKRLDRDVEKGENRLGHFIIIIIPLVL